MTSHVLRRALECAEFGWPVFPCQPGRLARLSEAGLLKEAGARVRTPGGGLHVYFAGSAQRSAHLPARHIDFLAAGGYALIPPSRVDGRTYQHTEIPGAGVGGLDWAAAVRLLEPEPDPQRAAPRPVPGERIDALARWVAAQREGNRNVGLFWAANRALEADQTADLSPLAAAARQTGLGQPEITRTLNSARRSAQARPEPPDYQAEPEPADHQAEEER
jgi:hypothetical protein